MSFINEQLTCAGMGAFIYCAARICRIYPIPIKVEMGGLLLALAVVWIVHQYSDVYSISFYESCRFLLLGFMPMRIVCWMKRRRNGQ